MEPYPINAICFDCNWHGDITESERDAEDYPICPVCKSRLRSEA